MKKITPLSPNYLSRRPIDLAMRQFGETFSEKEKVVDLGCGTKPYAKHFRCQYIGVDAFPDIPEADVIANAWETPFSDEEFDGVILNQSLEHIPETEKTIAEIYRILKPGGRCLISVPQTMRNHSIHLPSSEAPVKNFDQKILPYWAVDYYRFTIFGLLYLCRNFQVVSIAQTNSYPATISQLWNYFFASFNIPYLFVPVYLANNLIGIGLNWICAIIGTLPFPIFRKLDYLIFRALPLDNIIILKKP